MKIQSKSISKATLEGRKRGGLASCLKQQKDISEGKRSRFVTKKIILLPTYDEALAEAVGIILGDGGISKYQVIIYSSALVDKEYSNYVEGLFERLFGINVAVYDRKKNTIGTVISSRKVVEFFNAMGLKVGDKIKNGLSIPEWVKSDEAFLKACLRGLFDTDGCVFYHRHTIRGHEYNDIGCEFRNFNKNLLNEFQSYLLKNGYKSSIRDDRVVIYNRSGIHRYFNEVGTSNPKHKNRYDNYFSSLN